MEDGQREEGYLVTGGEGHPERGEIGWDEWLSLKRDPGEREREASHNTGEDAAEG